MDTTQKDNLIVQLTFQFALDIITFTEELEIKRKYRLANQLFGSGISIGANVREAQVFIPKTIPVLKASYRVLLRSNGIRQNNFFL